MKPASFEYHAPSTIDEALKLATRLGPEARFIAGGQSLVPMMNFRLVRPEHLIDLNGVVGLSYICADDGELRIGAMTRHREVETSAVIRERWPLISGCMPYVAHVQIRNRGTIGGSLSHADPAAELPAVMTALEAQFVIRSDSATRTVHAEDFFVGLMTTAMQPGELLIEVRIPPLPQGTGWAFDELSRRRGDFAIVGAAALVHCPGRRHIAWARLTFTGVGDRPVRAAKTERFLKEQAPREDVVRAAAEQSVAEVTPGSDLHASAEYRREVAKVMARRTLVQAIERAERHA
jgi:CO/xanthine dehydrogenase FAD-binding subunit